MLLSLSWFAAICESVSTPVPEFDGPAGIAAAALIISVAAVLYDKAKK